MFHALLFGRTLRPLRLAAFLVLLAVISWLALSPAPPRTMDLGWDKANHLCAFATLLVGARLVWPRRLLAVVIGLLAYGGLIELLQLNVPGRDGDWADLLADALGLGLGLALWWMLERLAALTRT